MRSGFTLLELMVVIAIIAILAVVAVPNFLEAQTRAKIGATEADMYNLAVAVEAYHVDHNRYPMDGAIIASGATVYPTANPSDAVNRHKFAGPALTTPIAYLTAQPHDPFIIPGAKEEHSFYFYANLGQAASWLRTNMGTVPPLIQSRMNDFGMWMMHAAGPDGDRTDIGSSAGPVMLMGIYDPTNGTISNGDIVRSQRRPSWR